MTSSPSPAEMRRDAMVALMKKMEHRSHESTACMGLRSLSAQHAKEKYKVSLYENDRKKKRRTNTKDGNVDALPTSYVLGQCHRSELADLVHEQVVEDYDYHGEGDDVSNSSSAKHKRTTDAQNKPHSLFRWNPQERCVVSATESSPFSGRGVTMHRDREDVVMGTILLTGDRGSGKTTLAAALTSGDMRVLQLLKYHTSSFYNLWIEPTVEDLATFDREMLGSGVSTNTESSGGGGKHVKRQLPFFPSQLCTGTCVLELGEILYFLDDEELLEGYTEAEMANKETLMLKIQNILEEGARRATEQQQAHRRRGGAAALPQPQSATLRVVEAGGDLLDSMMKVTEKKATTQHDEQSETVLAETDFFSVVDDALRPVLLPASHDGHEATTSTTLAYFVHCGTSLTSVEGLQALSRRILFLIHRIEALDNHQGDTDNATSNTGVRIHIDLYFSHTDEMCDLVELKELVADLKQPTRSCEEEDEEDVGDHCDGITQSFAVVEDYLYDCVMREQFHDEIQTAVVITSFDAQYVDKVVEEVVPHTAAVNSVAINYVEMLKVVHRLTCRNLSIVAMPSLADVMESSQDLQGPTAKQLAQNPVIRMCARQLVELAIDHKQLVVTKSILALMLFGDGSDGVGGCCGGSHHQRRADNKKNKKNDDEEEVTVHPRCAHHLHLPTTPIKDLFADLQVLPPLVLFDHFDVVAAFLVLHFVEPRHMAMFATVEVDNDDDDGDVKDIKEASSTSSTPVENVIGIAFTSLDHLEDMIHLLV